MEIEDIKQELGIPEIKMGDVHILFLDISSTCTGYSVATVNFEKKSAEMTKAGCLWLDTDWSHQEKYCYMAEAIRGYFWIVEATDYIVVEAYNVNPRKMTGVNVVSEMQGAIKAASWDNGVKVVSIMPQSWRSTLKIKKNSESDFKAPTKERVLEYVNVPEEVLSNLTGKPRKTPSDVYDAIAIGLAWLQRFGIKSINTKNVQFDAHIGGVNSK